MTKREKEGEEYKEAAKKRRKDRVVTMFLAMPMRLSRNFYKKYSQNIYVRVVHMYTLFWIPTCRVRTKACYVGFMIDQLVNIHLFLIQVYKDVLSLQI